MAKGINKEKENKIHKAVTQTDKKNLCFLSYIMKHLTEQHLQRDHSC